MNRVKRTDELKRGQILLKYFSDRIERHSIILIFVLLLALILRLMALLSLKKSVYFDFLLWDERLYHKLALEIMKKDHLYLDLYGNTIALVYRLFSVDTFYIRLLNIALGVFTCYLIYLIGRELVSKRIGIFSAFVAAIYKPFLFYNVVLLKTTLSVFLFALAVYCLVYTLNRSSRIVPVFLGFVLILLSNVRPNSVAFVPLVPIIMVWKYIAQGGLRKELVAGLSVYIVGVCIAVLPFYLLENEKPRGGVSQLAMNLYLGNNLQNPDPYYRPVSFATPVPGRQPIEFHVEARRRTGDVNLTEKEASRFWIYETIKGVLDQPTDFLWKMIQKTLAVINSFEAGDHYHVGFISDFIPFFKIPFPEFWLIFPLGMAGLILSGFRSPKMVGPVLLLFVYGATLVIFFTNTRYRLPMFVILIPFTMIGLSRLFLFVRQRDDRRIAVYCILSLVFFILEFLPIRGTGDLTAYYNTHAIVLNSKGLKSEALAYWETSSRMNKTFSVFANFSLAKYYMQNRELKRAIQYLEKIPNHSFAAAQKYKMLGDIWRRNSQPEEARKAYRASLDINASQQSVLRKLERLKIMR